MDETAYQRKIKGIKNRRLRTVPLKHWIFMNVTNKAITREMTGIIYESLFNNSVLDNKKIIIIKMVWTDDNPYQAIKLGHSQ